MLGSIDLHSTTAVGVGARSWPLQFLPAIVGWAQFVGYAVGADATPDGMPLGPTISAAMVAVCLRRSEVKQWGRRLTAVLVDIGG